jgi:hypothetical protein
MQRVLLPTVLARRSCDWEVCCLPFQVPEGASQLSGAVYMGSSTHKQMLNDAFCMFATSNPLHTDVWPSVS